MTSVAPGGGVSAEMDKGRCLEMRKLLLLATFVVLLASLETWSIASATRLVAGTLAGLAFAVAIAFLDRYEPGSLPR